MQRPPAASPVPGGRADVRTAVVFAGTAAIALRLVLGLRIPTHATPPGRHNRHQQVRQHSHEDDVEQLHCVDANPDGQDRTGVEAEHLVEPDHPPQFLGSDSSEDVEGEEIVQGCDAGPQHDVGEGERKGAQRVGQSGVEAYIQNSLAGEAVPPMPLDVLSAESQGLIGYFMQQAMRIPNRLNRLGHDDVVERVIVEVGQAIIQIRLHNIYTVADTFDNVLRVDFDAIHRGIKIALQRGEQSAVTATEIEDPASRHNPLGN